MPLIRRHAGFVAALVLVWQVFALAAVATALCCRVDEQQAVVDHSAHASHAEHGQPADHTAHAGMAVADSPMPHTSAPLCPRHPDGRDCDCPSMGGADAHMELTTLFGTTGILSAPIPAIVILADSDAAPALSLVGSSLAPDPSAPPPRA
jgi:hypothetical protein